jgi:5-formyltetrahydrofolate cyclo-ligase
MTRVAEEKGRLRAEVRRRLKELNPASIQRSSAKAILRLQAADAWRRAKSVLAYSATAHELDLWVALKEARSTKKIIALPRYDARTQSYCAALLPEDPGQLTPAGFGILEPPADMPCVPLNQLDFVLVPGLAFDIRGSRLGRGKGFYDRLLAEVKNGIKCGVALDEQIVERLPAEDHDVVMNFILTPTRWLAVPPVET